MPNVLLTESCVRSCPYCFAKQRMAEAGPEAFLAWEDLIYVADLQRAAQQPIFSLLGGEPTLHPDFVDFVLYLLERGFRVRVFTSGVLSDGLRAELQDVLRGVAPEAVSFVCNLNDPEHSPRDEIERVQAFLAAFGPRVVPGFNIYRVDFALDFLFQHINAFGLQRSLRLGIAHPIVGRANRYIRPQEMGQVGARLVAYLPMFERMRVRPGLDCGFPLCVFSEQELGQLYRACGGEVVFGCSPAVDVGPDLSVWPCFPLSAFHRRSLYEFDHLDQVHRFYTERFHDVRVEVGGIFAACDQCTHRDSGLCNGGCLAHALDHMQDEAPVRDLLRRSS